MPRKPLSQISANMRRGKELSQYDRGKIEALHNEGLNSTQIKDRTQISAATIRKTIQLNRNRTNGESRLRPGQPKKHDNRLKKVS